MSTSASQQSRNPEQATSPLILCADGGGSKVCVVIRSNDGVEVRGTAGPCNVASVGHVPAIQAILLATYRALLLLPPTHLPTSFTIPPLPESSTATTIGPSSTGKPKSTHPLPHLGNFSLPASPYTSRPGSPTSARAGPLPPLPFGIFQYAWVALAGISTPADSVAFMPHVVKSLCTSEERVKITNDVNLLAAPALDLPGIEHVVAVVCGTGTVGRTIKVGRPASATVTDGDGEGEEVRELPLEDVGVSRGWGYMLCDEGSAFWLGRLAIRSLLHHSDRLSSSPIHSTPDPPLLPLQRDLLAYFGTANPMDLIDLVSLTGPFVDGLSIGEAVAKRNAAVAGAARVVFRWAFPGDQAQTQNTGTPPTPPHSPDTAADVGTTASRMEALGLARRSIVPLIELTLSLLGDQSVVKPERTALALGGGLMMSKGYRGLLEEGLRKEGVSFGEEVVVADAAGVGAMGLGRVEFG